jgi:hypothetical protein
MKILLLKWIWHGEAFIFHRLKVTLNGNVNDNTKCEKKVKHFSETPVLQVPRKLAQYMESLRPVSESLYFKETYGLTVWLLDSSPWLHPTTKSALRFSDQISLIMDRYNGPQTSKKWRYR